jgi:hypothetical protein
MANDEEYFSFAGQPGGIVKVFKAAGALLIGDAVHMSAADTVNKTNVVANYVTQVGIVVGGFKTDMKILQAAEDIGEQAAGAANELVIVCTHGVCIGVAGAAINAGVRVTGGAATAGRVEADVTAGRIIGLSLEAAGAPGDKLRILVSSR